MILITYEKDLIPRGEQTVAVELSIWTADEDRPATTLHFM